MARVGYRATVGQALGPPSNNAVAASARCARSGVHGACRPCRLALKVPGSDTARPVGILESAAPATSERYTQVHLQGRF
jgi:hypothetical protein